MNSLITPDNFEFFARYLLAGLIVISVRSRFVVGERPKLTEQLVEAVALSLINQLAFLFLASLWSLVPAAPVLPARGVFFLEVLVLPATLGALFGWNRSLLRRLSMPVQNPARRAYDFAFGKHRGPSFVIVTFTDGTVVHGLFGEESLAASDGNRGDIYLERLYHVADDGQWAEVVPPRAMLLSLEGMRSIEFLELEGERERTDDAG
ncbi:hypothetical protein RSWS8N_01580 [Cereibacter sphaeroides WS8N]|uniref:DUF6338 family protein n=1 Tax=Cereibacter sphaeroides TaxID=1063 RepID=UPI00020DF7B2|nr:DUF6338 family protein [Cereibacter sphaeroides]EGJ20728.1 hypothetical protein RSWS8N_01580 [Cereibacter sphaeroides WS8N]